jgi:hypothetical protein
MSAAARSRPGRRPGGAAGQTRPRLAFNCGRPSLGRARSAATALALSPEARAISRSDGCGCEAMISALDAALFSAPVTHVDVEFHREARSKVGLGNEEIVGMQENVLLTVLRGDEIHGPAHRRTSPHGPRPHRLPGGHLCVRLRRTHDSIIHPLRGSERTASARASGRTPARSRRTAERDSPPVRRSAAGPRR